MDRFDYLHEVRKHLTVIKCYNHLDRRELAKAKVDASIQGLITLFDLAYKHLPKDAEL